MWPNETSHIKHWIFSDYKALNNVYRTNIDLSVSRHIDEKLDKLGTRRSDSGIPVCPLTVSKFRYYYFVFSQKSNYSGQPISFAKVLRSARRRSSTTELLIQRWHFLHAFT